VKASYLKITYSDYGSKFLKICSLSLESFRYARFGLHINLRQLENEATPWFRSVATLESSFFSFLESTLKRMSSQALGSNFTMTVLRGVHILSLVVDYRRRGRAVE
jgi:hypothetical protein